MMGRFSAAGTPEELADNEDVRRVYFGEDFVWTGLGPKAQ